MKPYLSIMLLAILFTACLPENETTIFEAQTEADIIKYIEDNNLNAERSDSGLYYLINEEGTGARPTPTSSVVVAYTGSFLDKIIFEKSPEEGVLVDLNNVIEGWSEGITYFREGGDGLLIIPPQLAYGNSQRGPIPPGTVLVFQIGLKKVN